MCLCCSTLYLYKFKFWPRFSRDTIIIHTSGIHQEALIVLGICVYACDKAVFCLGAGNKGLDS